MSFQNYCGDDSNDDGVDDANGYANYDDIRTNCTCSKVSNSSNSDYNTSYRNTSSEDVHEDTCKL